MKASLALLEQFFNDCDRSGWGYSEQQLAAVEAGLSVSFPKVLRQYYALFGTCPYITQEGDNIPVPLALEDFFIPDSSYNAPGYVPDELDFLVFSSVSNVSAIDYGIRLSDLVLDDPPVYYCDYGNTSWVLENQSLLNFLVTTAFWQIAWELRLKYCLYANEFSYDPPQCPKSGHYISSLGMEDHELENLQERYRHYRIFLKDGVILACDTDEWDVSQGAKPPWDECFWLTAASMDRGKILEIQKLPGLRWEETEI